MTLNKNKSQYVLGPCYSTDAVCDCPLAHSDIQKRIGLYHTITKLLSHFENGRYVTAYFMLGRTKNMHCYQFMGKYACGYKKA